MVYENSSGMYEKKIKKIQSVLVDCQRGIGGTLRVKPLTWGHGSNFGSPEIWVVTHSAFQVTKKKWLHMPTASSCRDDGQFPGFFPGESVPLLE